MPMHTVVNGCLALAAAGVVKKIAPTPFPRTGVGAIFFYGINFSHNGPI